MPDPINYSAMLAQLDVSPLLQLQQVQAQKRESAANEQYRQQQIGLLRQEAQEKAAQREAYDADVQVYMADPSSANLMGLIAKHPDQHQALRTMADQQDAAVKRRNFEAAMTLGGLVSAGQMDKALIVARKRREALANAGESTEITDSMITALQNGDAAAVRAVTGLVIAASGEPNQTKPVLETLGWDAASRRAERDDARADAAAVETQRHNRVTEGQGAARVRLSQQAGDRAATKAHAGTKPKAGAYTDAQLDGMLN